jgi:hypothetical protein
MRGSRGFARVLAMCALALLATVGWLAAGGISSARGLLLLVLTLAMFCFAIAAVPWPSVSWRMAYLVTPRQTDLTLLGFILMVAAGFTYVLTRGP